jgi:hypothetical protein
MNFDRAWSWIVALFFCVALFSGGNMLSLPHRTLTISICSLALFSVAIARLRNGLPTASSMFAAITVALALGLAFAQLVPLPPSIWHMLAGRQFLIDSLNAVDMGATWMPLSLSPHETRQNIVGILPAIASFLAVLTVPSQHFKTIAKAIVLAGVFCALVGLAQKFQGSDSALNFYNMKGGVTPSGFFANRNFYAAQLYCAIPITVALTVSFIQAGKLHALAIAAIGSIVSIVLIAGIGASGSRAGTVLAISAVFASTLLLRNSSVWLRPAMVSRLVILFAGLFTIVFAQLCLVALLRFANPDSMNDFRSTIYQYSYKALVAFFPVGSGFGSFVPVYQIFERPEVLIPQYINHAHNDWMELVIEGGLPMALILLGVGFWYFANTIALFRNARANIIAQGASISVGLLFVHSLSDYPLRAPALMVFCGICCGMMANGIAPQRRHWKAPNGISDGLKAEQKETTFRPRQSGFAKRTPES